MNAQQALKYLLDAPPGERVVHRYGLVSSGSLKNVFEYRFVEFRDGLALQERLYRHSSSSWDSWLDVVGLGLNAEYFPGSWSPKPPKKELPESVRKAVSQRVVDIEAKAELGLVGYQRRIIESALEALYNELAK